MGFIAGCWECAEAVVIKEVADVRAADESCATGWGYRVWWEKKNGGEAGWGVGWGGVKNSEISRLNFHSILLLLCALLLVCILPAGA